MEKRLAQMNQADAEYGRRVKEALDAKQGMNKEAMGSAAVKEAEELALAGKEY